MKRNMKDKRFHSRGDKSQSARPKFARLHVESLESRRLLTANDLLVPVFDDTGGLGVLRYNEVTHTSVPGGVPKGFGPNDLFVASGIAAAPDGTFYVSSLFNPKVLHYDTDGTFLDVLGANDAVPAPLNAPGTLAFGPNGHLYVGDVFGT